jgi:hypothetical protein
MTRNTPAAIDSNNSTSQDSAEIDAASNAPVSESPGTLVPNDEPSEDHSRRENPLVMQNLGFKDRESFVAFLGQMLNTTSRSGDVDHQDLKFVIAFVEDFGPRNMIEAAAALQMAMIHLHAMRSAQGASLTDNAQARELYERSFIKCSRTFMDYMGAVKDSRNACQPGVMVQNFVKDGQAIVGGGNIINNRNDSGPNTTAASRLTPISPQGRALAD